MLNTQTQPARDLVPSLAKADTGGMGSSCSLVGIDEAEVGGSHLQQGVGPHMSIFWPPCNARTLMNTEQAATTCT